MFKNLLNNKLMLGVFLIVLVLQFLITQVGTAVFEVDPTVCSNVGEDAADSRVSGCDQ